jgi:predicted DNA-binding transcriptional regulator
LPTLLPPSAEWKPDISDLLRCCAVGLNQYFQEMENIAPSRLTIEQQGFIASLATLLTGWNMPNNAARLYGYLQLQNQPMSLDDIVRDLGISKSNAWAAARVLEHTADVRRLTERGSKRISYLAGDDPGAPLRRQANLLGAMADLISRQKHNVAVGPASQRLGRLAEFHTDLQHAMEAVIMPQIDSRAA